MKTLQKPIVMAMNKTSNSQEVAQNKVSMLNVHGINFIRRNNTIVSVYYVKHGLIGSDLICEVRHSNSTYYTKVNDYPVLERMVKNYLPSILLVEGLDSDFLIVALSEGVLKEYRIKSTLLLKIYKVHYLPNIALFDMGKISLNSTVGSIREEVKYPVILHQSHVDTVIVIGRVDNDDRAKLPDRFYVMWRIRYLDGKFQLIKPATRETKFNAKYLFKYSGYIGYGKYSDKLIMVSESKDHLNLLYVGKYLSSDHKFFSNIYETSVNYNINLDIRECIINRRYGCNLPDDTKYHIPVSGINVINAIRIGEGTCIAYVGVVRNSKFKNDNQLVIIYRESGNQFSLYDFIQIEEHITSLYIKHVGNNIVITSIGSNSIIRSEISESQLKTGNITHIDVMRFSRREITDIISFIDIVTRDVSLEDVHAKVTAVEARKAYNNYIMSMFCSIREIQSKDIFSTRKSHITTNSINSTSIYEVTTVDHTTAYDLLKEHKILQTVTSSLSSTTKLHMEHMTTESLPYMHSSSKKPVEIEMNSTLYYSSPIISSTTQPIVLSTSSTKSPVEYGTTAFMNVDAVSTNHNRNIVSVTKIPTRYTTAKRVKFTTRKKHIGNTSDIEHGILTKKAKYNIRNTTQSSIKSKSTIRKHVFYDEDLETTSDYAITSKLNSTTVNVSRSDSFLLTNNSVSKSDIYPVGHGSSKLLIGAVFIAVLIIIFFVSILYNKSACNRFRQNLRRYMYRSSRDSNIQRLQVFELTNMQEIAGIQIPDRMACGNSL